MKRTLALIAAALLLAGCTKSATDPGGAVSASTAPAGAEQNAFTQPHTLRIGDVVDFPSLNPHLYTSLIAGNLNQLTMAYLVRYGHDNRPIPELATIVPTQANGGISKDGLTITWHLRRGVKWSDGTPFNADDLVFSTNAVNNLANNETGRDGFDLITRMDEPDKYTVVYHLKKRYSAYLPTFFGSAGANPCILPKHILGNLPNINHADYNSKPVGIGPFRYTKWVRGDRVEMEANPYYWRGLPKLKHITYRTIPDRNTLVTELTTGEIDMWNFVPAAFVDRVTSIATATEARGPSYLYSHVDFNTQHPALRDAKVREALELATDRKTLRDKLNHGVGILSETQVSPASPFYQAIPIRPYDVAAANKLLDEAGWKRGADGIRAKNGVRLNLVLATIAGANDTDQRIEVLRSDWKPLGVSLEVRHYNNASFFDQAVSGGILYGGKWDVTTFAWQLTPDGDLSNTNECNQIPPNGQNVTRLCNAGIDALLNREKNTYDEAQKRPIITKTVEAIDALTPYFVLFVYEDVHAYNKDLKGFHPNNTTAFDDFMNVDI